jgi:hypothetical protein
VAAIAGVALVALVWLSVLRTVFIPQRISSRAAKVSLGVVVAVGRTLANRLPNRRASVVMEFCAPGAMFVMATSWLVAMTVGFAALATGFAGVGFGIDPFVTFLTLRDTGPVNLLALMTWLSIALLLAAFTTHLFRFTSAYSRRERMVLGLATRATSPVDADQLLAGHLRTGSRDSLDTLFRDWVNWLADVKVTHTGYPALVYYLSSCNLAWFQAAVIMMDTAAVVEAVAPSWAPPHAKALLDSGSSWLRTAAEQVGVRLPDVMNTVSLHGREERAFTETVRLAVDAGLPAEIGCARAWITFQQLRRRYAPYAILLGTQLKHDPTAAEADDRNME